MLEKIVVPESRPVRRIEGYGMPEAREHLLAWDFVDDQMGQAWYYWISTVYPDGRPHAVPVWGIWFENRFYFDGSIQTAWAQNLVKDPRIALHLPDGDQVVMIEGTAHIIADDALSDDEWDMLDRIYQSKYQVDEGSPYWYIQPYKVVAWNGEDLGTMTRWIFGSG